MSSRRAEPSLRGWRSARYAMPNIVSVTKTDGLTFKVSEIVSGVARHIESQALEASVGTARQSALARG